MYEFDEQRWDRQVPEAAEVKGFADGWMIQSIPDSASPPLARELVHLQIGTGQWCSARYATIFPVRSAAFIYAKEFGYVVGETVRIVKHRF